MLFSLLLHLDFIPTRTPFAHNDYAVPVTVFNSLIRLYFDPSNAVLFESNSSRHKEKANRTTQNLPFIIKSTIYRTATIRMHIPKMGIFLAKKSDFRMGKSTAL